MSQPPPIPTHLTERGLTAEILISEQRQVRSNGDSTPRQRNTRAIADALGLLSDLMDRPR